MIGARLKQARMLAGMTQQQLADAIKEVGFGITKQAISKYETGKSFPSARFMLLASSILDVPSTYFMHEPETEVQWTAFRRHSGFGKRKQEALKAYAADLAELQVELHSLLYPNAPAALPEPVPVRRFEEVEERANHLRKEWKVGDRPLDNLVQTAEDKGMIVIGWDDESGEFDGLSGWCGEYPVTVINQNRSTDRIRFTLAHEIGHLIMDTSNAVEDEEKLAHRFAAAFLVPAEHALRELGNNRPELSWRELMTLKRKYGLSMAAWLGRARDLNIINDHTYKNQFIELSKRGWRKDEPGDYFGDEEPLLMEQMAHRALGERLIEPDRLAILDLEPVEQLDELMTRDKYPSATELLRMDEAERDKWVAQMFEWAKDVEFKIFEAYGEEEF